MEHPYAPAIKKSAFAIAHFKGEGLNNFLTYEIEREIDERLREGKGEEERDERLTVHNEDCEIRKKTINKERDTKDMLA